MARRAENENLTIARRLEEVARLLEEQGANPFRIQAYRRGAETVRRLDRPVSEILEREGIEGLRRLAAIGDSLSRAIRDLIRHGRLPMLERLRGESDPVELLGTVPGIGPVTAERLHHDLGIDTLEELEAAAHDGRLRDVAGLGEKRIAGIVDSLASRLTRVRRRGEPGGFPRALSDAPSATAADGDHEEPPVAEILDVDREYRERAAAGTLRKIAPRRLNPEGEAWLPILHAERGDRHYTVLYSNTARAHRLGKTRDWVVLFYDGEGRGAERQCTVITSDFGPLRGRRIVRGREDECLAHYGIAP
ncbi:MAG TPA: helix-hairpin-helix domain-containing protein [Candidatus Eisenbacteria bacterium]